MCFEAEFWSSLHLTLLLFFLLKMDIFVINVTICVCAWAKILQRTKAWTLKGFGQGFEFTVSL